MATPGSSGEEKQVQDQTGPEPADGPLGRLAFWDGFRGFDRTRVRRRRLLTSSRLARQSQRVEVVRARDDLIERVKKERDGEPPMPPGPAGAVNWTPVGPSVVTFGQATGNPAVSGRITSLAQGKTPRQIQLGLRLIF